MDLQPYRKQFDLHLLLSYTEEIQQLKINLRNKGHSVIHTTQSEKFFTDFKQSPSHLIILDKQLIKNSIDDFLSECLEIACQSHFIVLGPSSDRIQFLDYRDYGVLDYLSLEDQLLSLLEWSIDNALERVVLKVINKNLVEQNESLKLRVAGLKAKDQVAITLNEGFVEESNESRVFLENSPSSDKVSNSENQQESSVLETNSQLHEMKNQNSLEIKENEDLVSLQENFIFNEEDISNLLNLYENTRNREEILQVFFHSLEEFCSQGAKILFFKYLEPIQLLVATHGCGIPLEQIRGAGIKLTPDEILESHHILISPRGFGSLNKMLLDVFKVNECYVKPLRIREDIDGLFVFFGESLEIINSIRFNNRFSLFRVSFERFYFFKRQMELELDDVLRKIMNFDEFKEIVAEKMDQLKRQNMGLSILRMSVDRIQYLEEKYGPTALTSVLRSMAITGKKFSRSVDCFYRTGMNEFVLLASHLNPKDATILAERLRIAMEGMDIPPVTGSITISLGVSSYPQLATTPEALIKSSLQALSAAMGQGGNRVGLARVVRRPKIEKFPIESNTISGQEF